MITTSIFEIFKRLVKWDKQLEINSNGADNAYPERCERFLNNSVTASMASTKMAQYILGKGFGDADEYLIGDKRLYDLAKTICSELVENRGVFVHVSYDANLDISSFVALPFKTCRVGLIDSNEYAGLILTYPNWEEKKIDKTKIKKYNVFNPDQGILRYQISKCKGKKLEDKIKNYNGQVFYLNMDEKYVYPLSRIDAVQLECDNEHQASIYKNVLLRQGFFGKTVVITRPLIAPSYIEDTTVQGVETLRKLESEKTNFVKGLKEFIGVGNNGGIMHLEVDFAGERLEDAVLFKNIESKIDDQLFSFTENSAIQKILMAFNNLPISLVKSPDTAMFGNSGDSLRVAKEMYWEDNANDRNLFLSIINKFLKFHQTYKGKTVSIVPLLTPKPTKDDNSTAN